MLSQSDILTGQYFYDHIWSNVDNGLDELSGEVVYEGPWYGVEESSGAAGTIKKVVNITLTSIGKIGGIAKASIKKLGEILTQN